MSCVVKIVVQIQANVKSLDLIPREADVFSSALKIAVHCSITRHAY